jgi:sensor histidine kinase YesM
MQLVESYLSIMQIRLGEKLDFALELPETLKSTPFPALLLQTLVENAVTHGIEPADGPGQITIRAQAADGEVVITVTDNGVGFDTAVPAREGLGLQNIRERLAAFYGNAAALEIVSDPASGTVATVRIAGAGS